MPQILIHFLYNNRAEYWRRFFPITSFFLSSDRWTVSHGISSMISQGNKQRLECRPRLHSTDIERKNPSPCCPGRNTNLKGMLFPDARPLRDTGADVCFCLSELKGPIYFSKQHLLSGEPGSFDTKAASG